MGVQFCLYHSPGCEGEHRRQGSQDQTRAKLTSPYKMLTVGPCSAAETPDGSPLRNNFFYLDFHSDLRGSDGRPYVVIER